MNAANHLYCFDTSSFVEAYRRNYPWDVFPSLWGRMEDLIDKGKLVVPREVFEELKAPKDALLEWMKARDHVVVELDLDQQEALRTLQGHLPGFIDPESTKNVADPFVIALAAARSATVVTEEKPRRNSGPFKIPDGCQAMGVRCICLLEFMRDQELKF